MKRSFILAGVGGQGIVLASRIIAEAYLEQGQFVRTAETIGMSQRGGSVVSHVRTGEDIHSPQIPKGSADALIGFEPGEAVRCLPYLKPGGTAVVADRVIVPVTASLGGTPYRAEDMLAYLRKSDIKLIVLATDSIFRISGSYKSLNMALLGAVSALGIFDFPPEALEAIIKKQLPGKYLAANQKALLAGKRAGRPDQGQA